MRNYGTGSLTRLQQKLAAKIDVESGIESAIENLDLMTSREAERMISTQIEDSAHDVIEELER